MRKPKHGFPGSSISEARGCGSQSFALKIVSKGRKRKWRVHKTGKWCLSRLFKYLLFYICQKLNETTLITFVKVRRYFYHIRHIKTITALYLSINIDKYWYNSCGIMCNHIHTHNCEYQPGRRIIKYACFFVKY